MNDQSQTQDQLIAENKALRDRIAELEASSVWSDRENRFRKLQAQIPALVYQIERTPDHDFFSYIGNGCLEVFGLTPDEVLADIRSIRNLIHEEDRARFLATLEDSERTLSRFDIEYRIRDRSGKEKWLRATSTPSRASADHTLWSGIIVDITESKHAEFALRNQVDRANSLARTMRLLASSAVAIGGAKSIDSALPLIAQYARAVACAHQAAAFYQVDEKWQLAVSASQPYETQLPNTFSKPPEIFSLAANSDEPVRLTQEILNTLVRQHDIASTELPLPSENGWMAVPMINAAGENIGLIQVGHRYEREFDEADESHCMHLAKLSALELELTHANEILETRVAERTSELETEQQFLRSILDLNDHERKQIAYDLHDGLIQYIVAVQMHLNTVCTAVDRGDRVPTANLRAAHELIDQAISEGRRFVSDVRPLLIDAHGLVQAIQNLLDDEQRLGGIETSFRHDGITSRFDPLLEDALFRIAQEALANVRKHSGVKQAAVELTCDGTSVSLTISDEGVGFDPDQVDPSRFGLSGIRERTRIFSGHCSIESEAGKGTVICVTFNLTDQDRPAVRSRP